MANKTRKQKKQQGGKEQQQQQQVMTIPKLRKAFESINIEVKRILAKHPINKDSVDEFKKKWKQIFGKTIDQEAAESYLNIQSKQKKKDTRKKSQKGGVASVDYMLRPGSSDASYGSFPTYISSGLQFGDHINKIAMDADCGIVDTTPQGIVGGATASEIAYSVMNRPFARTEPTTVAYDAESYFSGRSLPVSPKIF